MSGVSFSVTQTARTDPRAGSDDRDWGLDALRAIACLLVFPFHVDAGYGLAGGWLRGGGVARVYILVVLSGFLLYRPFIRRPAAEITGGEPGQA